MQHNLLNIKFLTTPTISNEAITVMIGNDLNIDYVYPLINSEYHDILSKIVKNNNGIFSGKFGQIISTQTLSSETSRELKTIIIVGLGNANDLGDTCVEKLGSIIFSHAKNNNIENLTITLNKKIGHFEQNKAAALIANGALLNSYKFDKFFTKQKNNLENFKNIKNIEFIVENPKKAEVLFNDHLAVTSGVFFARDLVNQPPNILYPESYALEIKHNLEPLGVKVTILGVKEMKELGMGALLGVAQGSANEPRLVVMEYYNNPDKNKSPLALVGKGVTFDTGGICIKPSVGMGEMKYDMAGSAAVVGAIKAVAARKAKANIVGVVGLVENMPSGTAQRPSDVVSTMSGQTAEVVDTDAEGRLVLADAIWYAQENFKPDYVVDLATLTGAIVIALGNSYAGCFANNEEFAKYMIEAGKETGEEVWHMPLHEDYDRAIDSEIADVANLSNIRGAAGSATAAHFIGRFIQKDVHWIHLDIAGTAWNKKDVALKPKGASGYGVRLLDRLVKNHFETN